MFGTRRKAQQWVVFSAVAVSFGLCALMGCGGTSSPIVNQILDAQIREQFGALPTETATIHIINNTELTIELDVLLDSTLVTITCTAEEGRCSYLPTTCPQLVQAVEERRFTVAGVYTGGRFFSGNAAYTFDNTEFDCQSVIVFTVNDDNTIAQVL